MLVDKDLLFIVGVDGLDTNCMLGGANAKLGAQGGKLIGRWPGWAINTELLGKRMNGDGQISNGCSLRCSKRWSERLSRSKSESRISDV